MIWANLDSHLSGELVGTQREVNVWGRLYDFRNVAILLIDRAGVVRSIQLVRIPGIPFDPILDASLKQLEWSDGHPTGPWDMFRSSPLRGAGRDSEDVPLLPRKKKLRMMDSIGVELTEEDLADLDVVSVPDLLEGIVSRVGIVGSFVQGVF